MISCRRVFATQFTRSFLIDSWHGDRVLAGRTFRNSEFLIQWWSSRDLAFLALFFQFKCRFLAQGSFLQNRDFRCPNSLNSVPSAVVCFPAIQFAIFPDLQ